MVEVGVHEDYVEHWVRQDGPVAPCWALFAENAILLRAGAQFGLGGPKRCGAWTRSAVREWTALNPHVNGDDLVANGVGRSIEDSEGDVDL